MRNWKRLAIASVMGAGVAMPVFAADGDALQSQENQHGNAVERNTVLAPSSAATPVPMWDGARGLSPPTTAIPSDTAAAAVVSPSGTMSGAPSAAEESRATGKVDAPEAAPPRSGSDVQAGDMGPSSPKAGAQ